jgi:hypothetical protein
MTALASSSFLENQSARWRRSHTLPAHGAGAGRFDVSKRLGEELPRASVEHDDVSKVGGGGICERTSE